MSRLKQASVSAVLVVTVAIPCFAQRVNRRIFVRATDAAGAAVPGLTAADFELTDGGKRREVTRVATDAPMRVLLLVDSTAAVGPMITSFRGALQAFSAALDPGTEVGLITTGGQFKVRFPPGTNRQEVQSAMQSFAPESGGNTVVETMFEADRRLFQSVPDRWPVLVIVTTDSGLTQLSGNPYERYNRFVGEYVARGGSAHAVIIRSSTIGIISAIVSNLIANTNGILETMAIAIPLPEKLQAIAQRISADRVAMTGNYELEYNGGGKVAGSGVEVRVKRDDVQLRVSGQRPF